VLTRRNRYDEALREIERALRLDSESYEVNDAAAQWHYRQRHFDRAIEYWEKAAALMESDYRVAGMLVSCYKALGNEDGARQAARRSLQRAEEVIRLEPDNGSAMSHAVAALATLGEADRAKELAVRAMLLDPDNINMRYNFACTYILNLGDHEAALDLLEPMFEMMLAETVSWAKVDPDLDAIREHPRYKALIAAAEARLAMS
jgi:adenylate cyclase